MGTSGVATGRPRFGVAPSRTKGEEAKAKEVEAKEVEAGEASGKGKGRGAGCARPINQIR
jgi:hypothetical protein